MTTFERRKKLLDLLRAQSDLQVTEVAQVLGVSEGTVRNDIKKLEAEGQLKRVRGGATLSGDALISSPTFSARLKRNSEPKQMIARWAAELVEDGDSILLDASSTAFSVAQQLQGRRRLRVITNGIETARVLAHNPTNTVILLGGVLNMDGSSITGSLSERFLEDLFIQTAFVSCSGITPEVGLTEVHIYEAQLKRKAIQSAKRVIALADSSKFGKIDLTPFARLEQITQLFTDSAISQEWIDKLRGTCLTFTICDKDAAETFSPCGQDSRHYRIAFANLSENLPFCVDVRRGLEKASQAAGNIDLILADNQLDPDVAVAVAERFTHQKPDLVIEYQVDETLGNRLMSMYQQENIPVIAVDIPMVGATFFGVDNYRVGQVAGVALGEWIRNNWSGDLDHLVILEQTCSGSLPEARIQGQVEGLVSILGPIPMEKQIRVDLENSVSISREKITALLKQIQRGRHIAFITFNDEAALGAMQAARQLNRLDDVIIVGQGADRAMRAELRRPDTRVLGSTDYLAERYGELLVSLALRILRGESVPPAVYIQSFFACNFITPQNINQYYPETREAVGAMPAHLPQGA